MFEVNVKNLTEGRGGDQLGFGVQIYQGLHNVSPLE